MQIKAIFKLLIIIIGCELVGIVGSLFTFSAIANWYSTLNKPFFSPPNWLFGPTWTLLYLLMGVAIFLIIQNKQKTKQVKKAVQIFILQLALNFIWTPIFFGLKAPLLALLVIIALWFAILATIKSFWPISKLASSLLIPYLLWVSFATLLNGAIVWLN